MEFAREDWLLVLMAAAVILPLGYTTFLADDSFTPETELERYCVSLAADVEANATFAHRLDDCSCIPPKRVDESQFSAPEKVENSTRLFLVRCKFDDGQTSLFPVRRVRDDYTGDLNRNNTSVLRDSP